MRWIVGTDLGDRSAGALRMAAWLQGHARGGDATRLVGIHVIDERVRTVVEETRAAQLIEGAGELLHRHVERLGIAGAFAELRTVLAASPEAGITAALGTVGHDGAVIGRIARTDAATPWRLGSVARRLLRRLPAPIMVVPPDLGEIGRGPVLLATDLHGDSVAAGMFAQRLARTLARPLVVAYVDLALVLSTSEIGYGIPMPLAMHPRTIDDIERWVWTHGLRPASTRLLEGDVVDRLLHCARQADAPVLVCGSRRLGLGERIFSSSVGTELARRADRAVLVVPPADD